MKFVHSWPVAECSRLARNSSSPFEYQHALANFIEQLVFERVEGSTIAKVIHLFDQWQNCCNFRGVSSRSGAALKTFTLVLPYHPVWNDASPQGVISKITTNFGCVMHTLFGTKPSFRLAWKCLAPSMAVLCRVRA